MTRKYMKYAAAALVFAATQVLAVAPAFATAGANGNNGTLKVHEIGTPVGTENNDPKVCAFNLEGFGFDAGQSGYVVLDVQGKDAPKGVTLDEQYAFGPTDTTGYAVTQNFNSGAASVNLADGHYKATLYGKDRLGSVNLKDVKAKSKVFKVTCDEQTDTDTPVQDTPRNENGTTKPDKSQGKPKKDDAQTSNPTGNNGTLKVHEIGTPVGTENNDPKVCAFNLEGFGFDAGQSGYLKFEVQGKDAPHGVASEAVYVFGPTDSKGYAISRDFNNGASSVSIPDGHYKVTLYGKDTGGNVNLADVKAKSKVFKVTCEQTTPPTPTTPTTPTTPGGQVLGETTTAPKTGVLQDTGSQIVLTTLMSAVLVAAAIKLMGSRNEDAFAEKQEQINLIAL